VRSAPRLDDRSGDSGSARTRAVDAESAASRLGLD